MQNKWTADRMVDAKGLACPMPIVRTKQALQQAAPGELLEIQATDRGSATDIRSWAQAAGHLYIGTNEVDGVLYHYVRKAEHATDPDEIEHSKVISTDELKVKMQADSNIQIVDVRETLEYAFGHIPGAISIPLGVLEARKDLLDAHKCVYVICRSGNRSNSAAKWLTDQGFEFVWNVKPGMSGWNGPVKNELEAIVPCC